ncbi:ArsA family ATPase [Niallia sp. 03190]|uniref:ArsA family ATPase n=1 Tax=Niallia sp. 03190 TaxID=3458061 RepID=UPI00404494CE
MRIIIYTGKGGVGKTSIAAATAVQLAKLGLRTLVMSTDAAHSLSDAFDQSLSDQPLQLHERLWGVEVNSLRETERNWGAVQQWLGGIMKWAQLEDIGSEEIMIFPGMEELFSLMQIKTHAQSGKYDVIIVDCAPTGETLRLLSYPNLLKWWLEKIFPYERRLIKVVRPVSKMVMGGLELPNDDVLNSIERFVRELEEMNKILLDEKVTSVRIVLNPEKMVIAESRRAFTYLNLFGFNTDAIFVNRVIPEEAREGFLANWHHIHQRYDEEIKTCFEPLPIYRIPLMPSEVSGRLQLEQLSSVGFGETDMSSILFSGKTEQVRKEEGQYILEISLPFVSKDEIELSQKGEELIVQIGAYKRKLVLPRILVGRSIESARLADHILALRFSERMNQFQEGEELI